MDNKSLAAQMKAVSSAAFEEEGLNVVIDRSLPSVAVFIDYDQENGYYFQEHEAEPLLEEANNISEEYDVSPEEYIAFKAQSW